MFKDSINQKVGVATVPTVYGIETPLLGFSHYQSLVCCNSTYRLRY